MNFADGGCTCGHLRYRLLDTPLFVHCCHCTWCQRESGSAFAVNAIIETSNVDILQGDTDYVKVPSPSGKGQTFARCAKCHIAVWSHYAGAGRKMSFIRVGTLDDPSQTPPDIHIYVSSKQSFVTLPSDIPCREGYYDRNKLWPKESLERRKAAMKMSKS